MSAATANRDAIARAALERRTLATAAVAPPCHECVVIFAGTRAEALAAGWETYSTRTQHDLDAGPLVCPECVAATLTDTLAAMRRAYTRPAELGPFQ